MPGVGGLTLGQASTLVHPGYVAGRWYIPFPGASPGTTGAYIATQVRLSPFMVSQQITISDLCAEVATLAVAGNIALAVYGSDATTKMPSGAPLAVTGSISVAATGAVSGDITGADVTLPAGLYWLGSAADNATVILSGTLGVHMQHLYGASSVANALNSGATYRLLFVINSTTYGTWPVAGVGNLVETASVNGTIGGFKVSGVG